MRIAEWHAVPIKRRRFGGGSRACIRRISALKANEELDPALDAVGGRCQRLANPPFAVSYYAFRPSSASVRLRGLGVEIWPAIDLRGGKCVRLRQGDYAQETVFGDDPAAMARKWAGQGGKHLHLVDLDAAKDGSSANLASVRAIVEAVSVPCELGGGVRSREMIEELLEIGLARLVVGTRALKEPDWFRQVCREFPDRLVLGIDARGGMVATDGWLETSEDLRDRIGVASSRANPSRRSSTRTSRRTG